MSTSSDRRPVTLLRTDPAAFSSRTAVSGGVDRARAAPARVKVTPVRSWTTPSCRSLAMRRRSTSDAVEGLGQQRLALLLALAQLSGQPVGQRYLQQLEHDQRTEGDRREAPPDAVGRGRHDVEAEVGLEEQALAARRPDGQVDLEELVEAALEAVLGLGQVAHPGMDEAARRASSSSARAGRSAPIRRGSFE